MAQTKAFQWYQYEQPLGIPGMKADASVDVCDSFCAEVSMNPGEAVIRGTLDGQAKPVAAAADISNVIGVAVHTHKEYEGIGAYYEEGYCLPVMTFGDVYVAVGNTVTAGGQAALVVGADGPMWVASGTTVVTSKTAGYNEYTITTNAAASTDTVTFDSVTLTAGTDFVSGANATATAAAIAAAFQANATLAAKWVFTSDGAKICVTEKDAGGGDTPGSMTYTGTIVISAGSATSSATTTANSTDVSGMTYLASGVEGDIVPLRVRK